MVWVTLLSDVTPNSATESVNYSGATVEVGAGLAFRFSSKFNLGLEYTVAQVLGSDGDLLDGDNNQGDSRTTYRDAFHWPHLSLNFNIGGKDKMGKQKI